MGYNNILSIQLLSLLLVLGILFLNCQAYFNNSCQKFEKEALLKLKQGLNDSTNQLLSWNNKDEDCCRWKGVSCSTRTGRIVKLDLRNPYPETELGLSGKIDSSLVHLEELSYLDLSLNNFGGIRIPSFFGELKKLRYLNLSSASFGGTIPPSIGNLSSLEYLDLDTDFKELSDSDSDLLWLSSLSSLKYLNMGGVDLGKAASYWVQMVNNLPSLKELHLYHCGLSNLPLTLPSVNMSSLVVLDLSGNGFSSPIPHWLCNVSHLKHLNLKANNFQGELPDELVKLSSLQLLDLSENSFIEGRLTKNFGKLCNLRTLLLSVNKITGDLTDFFDSLSQCSNNSLENLDLGTNRLGGNLPDSIGNLKKLRYLQFWQNSIQGSIPQTIGNLSYLEVFSMSTNQMKGTIPESLGQLSSLTVLDLSENDWQGAVTEAQFVNLSSFREMSLYKVSPNISLAFSISSDWLPPFKLKYLDIRSCQLGPQFPSWLRNQSDLTTLKLNNARISDTIPDWFWQLNLQVDELDIAYNQISGRVPNTLSIQSATIVDLSTNRFEGPLPLWSSNMIKLYLRDNLFSGPIPPAIGDLMPSLTDLDISRNSLNGTIPLSIGNLVSLSTLVISNNYLTGEIPSFWETMPFLYIVDMSNNSLSGTILESIGSLVFLRFLILSNNNLSGELPPLKNCSDVESLDLGENKLSGDFPAWIGKSMKSLLILRLRSNFFTGEIPSDICSLSILHIFDLSHNKLSGKIPPCIGNLTGLKTELTDQDTLRYEGKLRIVAKGRVLEYDSTLYLVNSLDLSDNNLSGEIPAELTSLVKLWSLNLSMNQLTGSIPPEIGNMAWLETLDLSKNNLSGPIPPRMTQLTFLNHLDLSYNNLSGKIPTTNQFQSLNDPSIYEGNPELCGLPLPTKCPEDKEASPVPGVGTEDEDSDDDLDKLWFFLSMGLGFTVGFWGVCATLIIKQSWRVAYFRFVEDKKDALFRAIARCLGL